MSGIGITDASIGGKREPTGGAIDPICMTNADSSQTCFCLDEIAIAGSAFHTALRADGTGTHFAALENVFRNLACTICGTDQVESFISA